MSSSLNIKNLPVSEPHNLYSQLENAVNFSEGYSTSKVEDNDNGEGYLLAGLYMGNFNDAGIDEEQVGRLSNALETEILSYAIFPNDQRNGYLPLVLDDSTRTYLETNIEKMFSNKYLKWYIYFLPNDIDADDNELSGSTMLKDENGEPITVEYKDIEKYLMTYGHVEESDENEMFEEEDDEKNKDDSEKESDSSESSNDLPANLDSSNEEDEELHQLFSTEDDETLDFDDDKEDIENFEEIDQEDNYSDKKEQAKDDLDKDEILDLEDEKDEMDFELDKEEFEMDSEDDNDASIKFSFEDKDLDSTSVTNETNEINETIENYTGVPESLKTFLDNIGVRKFSDFNKDGLNPVTANTMQKEIDYANSHIDEYINNIKRKAIDQYQKYMAKSHETIREEIDTNTGNEAVKAYYQNVLSKEETIEEQYNKDIEEHFNKLENEFYTTRLEDYKEQLLAKAKEWHEEENLERLVKKPWEDYKADKRSYYDDRKIETRADFNAWLANIEDVAKGKDQAQAIEKAKDIVNQELKDLENKIDQYNENMHKLNNELINIEYNERATEHVRKSAGDSLQIDQHAKIYKQQVDDLIKKNADMEKQFKEDLEQQNKAFEEKQKDFESTIKDVKMANSEKEAEYQKHLNDYKQKASVIETENEKLKQSKNTDKKKNMRNSILAFAAAGLLFSGGGYALHSASENEHADAMKKQETRMKNTQSDLDKKEKELQEQKASNSKLKDEQNKKLKESEQRVKDAEKKLKEAEDKAKKSDKKKKDN